MTKQLFLKTLCLTLFSFAVFGQSPCTPHDHPSNEIRSKGFTDVGGQTIANDFHISANTLVFEVEEMEVNLWTLDDTVGAVDLIFHYNDGRHPGTVVGDTIQNIIPTSQEVIDIDEVDGFQIRKVILDLPTPFALEGNGTAPVKYWVQLIAHPTTPGSRIGWEINGNEVYGEGINYTNPTIDFYYVNDNWDGVFKLSGQCTLAEGCLIPESVTASNISTDGANINWTGFPEATSYVLVYGESGFDPNSDEGETLTIPGDQTSILLEDLELVTTYDVYIKTICTDGESIFTVPYTFTTADIYCDMDALVEIEPITYIEFAGVANRTDAALNESPGHEIFLDIEGEVVPGQTYTLTMEGNTGGNYENGITVFIDWNQDGSFDNNTERYDIGVLSNSSGEDGIQISAEIEVPTTVAPGKTRMRILKEFYAGEYVPDACTWLSYGQAEDYSLVIDLEDCEGTPNAGITTVDPEMGNPNNSYMVSATDYSVSNGITYQWQSNTDGEGWVDQGESGTIYTPYSATAPSEGGIEVQWRLKVTCTASQETSYSEIATYSTYTELTYCQPVLLCSQDDVITNVSFQEIDNTTECSPEGYGDYTHLTATVAAGERYPLSVSVGSGWNVESVSVWIDFDNDGVFDQNEFFYLGTGSGEAVTGEISIPSYLEEGDYRMRVRVAAVDFDGATWEMSCNEAQSYGETEDYTVTVSALSVDDHENVTTTLFPNPTTDILNLHSNQPISHVVVYNLLGQKVLEQSFDDTQLQMDVSNLGSGMYSIQVSTEKTRKNYKFIKK